eukprot:1209977-Pyramimonas_sp.AAC.1
MVCRRSCAPPQKGEAAGASELLYGRAGDLWWIRCFSEATIGANSPGESTTVNPHSKDGQPSQR